MAPSKQRTSSRPRVSLRHSLSGLLGVALAVLGCRSSEPARATESPAAPSQATAAAAPAACGGSGQDECPTQRWMKSTLQAYLRTHDYKRLEASFKELAGHAPAGYERWQHMAESGARAAANQDESQVRQTCQACHDDYRAQFRRDIRSAQLM